MANDPGGDCIRKRVSAMEKKKLLEIQEIDTSFQTDEGLISILDHVSFDIDHGETLGVVGESGSGKSVTALSVMRLLPRLTGKVTHGRVIFNGKNLLDLSEREMQSIRGKEIAMIFQEPMTSLDPVYTIGDQIMESLIKHEHISKKEARERAIHLLDMVGIPSPERRVDDYPHQMSGGMRQRVMIAIALSCNPKLLIADEPTTALDVTIQAQILDIMRKLKKERDTSIWLVTHDLSVIAEMCDRVVVMYGGRVCEIADVDDMFHTPAHPYTRGLLDSIPRMDKETERLHVINGGIPNLKSPPSGCRFHPRCEYATEECKEKAPVMREVAPGHCAACYHCLNDMEGGVK